jgi:hypothetical protein
MGAEFALRALLAVGVLPASGGCAERAYRTGRADDRTFDTVMAGWARGLLRRGSATAADDALDWVNDDVAEVVLSAVWRRDFRVAAVVSSLTLALGAGEPDGAAVVARLAGNRYGTADGAVEANWTVDRCICTAGAIVALLAKNNFLGIAVPTDRAVSDRVVLGAEMAGRTVKAVRYRVCAIDDVVLSSGTGGFGFRAGAAVEGGKSLRGVAALGGCVAAPVASVTGLADASPDLVLILSVAVARNRGCGACLALITNIAKACLRIRHRLASVADVSRIAVSGRGRETRVATVLAGCAGLAGCARLGRGVRVEGACGAGNLSRSAHIPHRICRTVVARRACV